jgi:hypothetical protein
MSEINTKGSAATRDSSLQSDLTVVPADDPSLTATSARLSTYDRISSFYPQLTHCIMLPLSLKTASIGVLSTFITGPSVITVLGGLGFGMAVWNMSDLLLGEEHGGVGLLRRDVPLDEGGGVVLIPAPSEDEAGGWEEKREEGQPAVDTAQGK